MITFVIEPVVFSSLDDAEEKKRRQASSPQHNENRVDDLAGMLSTAEAESDNSEDNEVSSTCKICLGQIDCKREADWESPYQ